MSNLTKLEEVASRIMAGLAASPTWEESTYKESSEGARIAAQALLAECARHEPKPEPMKYGPPPPRTPWRKPIITPEFSNATILEAIVAGVEAVRKHVPPAPEIPWITHDGGAMPCENGHKIEVMFRDGSRFTLDEPETFRWNHEGIIDDIMKWRPVF